MINKIKALIRFQINISLDNKVSFLFSLLFPIGFIVSNLSEYSQKGFLNGQQQFLVVLPYISYVVILGMLYGWVEGTSATRENNFLKMFTSLVGDKRYIFVSNFIVNFILILIQSILINLIFQIVTEYYSFQSIVLTILVVSIMSTVSFLGLSLILHFKIRAASLQIFLTGYLIVGLFLLNIDVISPLIYFVMNIFNLYYLSNDLGLILINKLSLFDSLVFVLITCLLLAISGWTLISKIPVFSKFNRG